MKFTKTKAFTFAEVLITLGIIGVVAALTIPTLITSYHKKVIETELKKFDSTIQQAFELIYANEGDLSFFDTTKFDDADINGYTWNRSKLVFDKYFANTFKTVEVYPKNYYKQLHTYSANGTSKFNISPYVVWYLLPNGKIIGLCSSGNRDSISFVLVINPSKSKLIVGKDFFEISYRKDTNGMYSTKNNEVYSRYNTSMLETYKNACKSNTTYPLYSYPSVSFCTFLIINNGYEIPKDYPVRL